MDSLVPVLVCAGFLTVAAVHDLRRRRIPNWLTLTGVVTAVLSNSILEAGIGSWPALAGIAVALAVMLPLFGMRAIGGGDVKLIAMVGGFLGPLHVLGAILATFLVGGLLAVCAAWRAGHLGEALFNLRQMLIGTFFKLVMRLPPTLDPLEAPAARMPYGIAIALGTLLYLLWLNIDGGRP